MGWKNWSYSLRWGIIGSIIGAIYYFAFYLMRFYDNILIYITISPLIKIFYNFGSLILIFNSGIYARFFVENLTDSNDLLFFLKGGFPFIFTITIIEFFVIGAIIGFRISRIKK